MYYVCSSNTAIAMVTCTLCCVQYHRNHSGHFRLALNITPVVQQCAVSMVLIIRIQRGHYTIEPLHSSSRWQKALGNDQNLARSVHG